jgi:hypothetical protein
METKDIRTIKDLIKITKDFKQLSKLLTTRGKPVTPEQVKE